MTEKQRHSILCVLLPILVMAACGGDPQATEPDAAPAADASAEPQFEAITGSIGVFEITATDGTPTSDVRAAFYEVDPQEVFYVETAREGSCRLLVHEVGFCDPICGMTEICTHEGVCEEVWRPSQSAGVITVSGLTTSVSLTPDGGWYIVDPQTLPTDLFAADDPITASAPGDEAPGFEVSSAGVSPADLPLTGAENDELLLVDGDDAAISWSAAAGSSRARLTLYSPASWHGLPPRRILECDAPDTGSMVIPQALLEAFPEQAREEDCHGYLCDVSMFPRSTFLRYRRALTTAGEGEVELVVGSKRLFYFLHEVE